MYQLNYIMFFALNLKIKLNKISKIFRIKIIKHFLCAMFDSEKLLELFNVKSWCINWFMHSAFFAYTPIFRCKQKLPCRNWNIKVEVMNINACVKGHLEPTHLKSLPLFTFSTNSLGQDSSSVHLFSKKIGSRFTTAKIKLGEDSPS